MHREQRKQSQANGDEDEYRRDVALLKQDLFADLEVLPCLQPAVIPGLEQAQDDEYQPRRGEDGAEDVKGGLVASVSGSGIARSSTGSRIASTSKANDALQVSVVVIMPPMSGPVAAPSPAVALTTAKAFVRSSGLRP